MLLYNISGYCVTFSFFFQFNILRLGSFNTISVGADVFPSELTALIGILSADTITFNFIFFWFLDESSYPGSLMGR